MVQMEYFVSVLDWLKNYIKVKVEKKNGRVYYFTEWWASMKDYYNILGCSWITLIYANCFLFLFRGVTWKEEEFIYPRYSPPKRMLLQHLSPGSLRNTIIPNALDVVYFLPRKFYHSFEKSLPKSDVNSGFLVWCLLNLYVYVFFLASFFVFIYLCCVLNAANKSHIIFTKRERIWLLI